MNYPQNGILFWYFYAVFPDIDGLVQERCNSIANTLDLCFSSIKPSICTVHFLFVSYFELNIVEPVVVLLTTYCLNDWNKICDAFMQIETTVY